MTRINSKAFFSAVLKAIACTRNSNTDQAQYAVGVLEPASRIRAFEAELGDRELSHSEAEQVLGWLETTFETKGTPDEERSYYRGRIAELSGLTLVRAGVAA
jgi:hypothetical protein